MTNYEKIKSMSVDEMARFIESVIECVKLYRISMNLKTDKKIMLWHGFCEVCDRKAEDECWTCTKKWLEREWLESELDENE